MAKRASTRKAAKKSEPEKTARSSLTMSLFAPGMSVLHRAGLGGLACTLRWIEQAKKRDVVSDKQLPGSPWDADQPPWTITSDSITLHFGAPEHAREFLKQLFGLAFTTTRDGLICLNGQYSARGDEPLPAALAEIQNGLTLTFLQHGKTRTLEKQPTTKSWRPDETSATGISVQYKACSWFKHQDGWQELIDNKGRISSKTVDVIGPLCPGAVVRHVAFNSSTKIEDPVERVLPLYFAILGCLVAGINRGSGVLLVPEVTDLQQFAKYRPQMNPENSEQFRVASPSDAALQAQVRLWAAEKLDVADIPACHAVLFRPTSWASQQKSRVETVVVQARDATQLKTFQIAMANFKPRLVTPIPPASKSVAKKAARKSAAKKSAQSSDDAPKQFWSDSIVRPLIADNLARGQPWYRNFIDLMTKTDSVSKKPKRLKLYFEKEGLSAMIEKIAWQDEGEGAVVRAVHEAMRCRLGAIADENKNNSAARKKRSQGEFDKWRLAFAGSKTIDQFRKALCDLVSRAGANKVLREHWEQVLPWLSDPSKWQLTRDLSLLALCSYSGKGVSEIADPALVEASDPAE